MVIEAILGQRATGLGFGSIADEIAEGIHRMGGKAEFGQGFVHCIGKVLKCIEERAVEIEEYCFKVNGIFSLT